MPSATQLILLAEPPTAATAQLDQDDQWQIEFLGVNRSTLTWLKLRHPAAARRIPVGSAVVRQINSLSTPLELDLARYYGKQLQELGWRLVESGRNEGAAWQGWDLGDHDVLNRRVDLLTTRWWSEPSSCLVWAVARVDQP